MMTLFDFLKKNNRKNNILVCTADGEEIGSQVADVFNKRKHPEFADVEDFALRLDDDNPIGSKDVSRKWYRFWQHYWEMLLEAEVIKVRQDRQKDIVTVFLEPELYYYGDEDKVCRLSDIKSLYKQAQKGNPELEDMGFQEFYDYAVNSKESFITRIL